MATLTLAHRGAVRPHDVSVAGWDPVVVDDEAGVVEVSAHGGNVLLRLGSPGPDFSAEVAVHDGETREITVDGRLYARAFPDRPVGEF